MPNAYFWWQGGVGGVKKTPKPAYVIHGCSHIWYMKKTHAFPDFCHDRIVEIGHVYQKRFFVYLCRKFVIYFYSYYLKISNRQVPLKTSPFCFEIVTPAILMLVLEFSSKPFRNSVKKLGQNRHFINDCILYISLKKKYYYIICSIYCKFLTMSTEFGKKFTKWS